MPEIHVDTIRKFCIEATCLLPEDIVGQGRQRVRRLPRIVVASFLLAGVVIGCGEAPAVGSGPGSVSNATATLSASGDLTMATVPSSAMAGQSITLWRPSRAAAVPQAAAEKTAVEAYHTISVSETQLAEVSRPHLFDHKLFWVVSLPPQYAPLHERPFNPEQTTPALPVVATYLVVFVDADTGASIFAIMGNEGHVIP